jgi:hypothetical protein
MLASEVRIIAHDNDSFQAEIWWAYAKDNIFKIIKSSALNGKYEVVIRELSWFPPPIYRKVMKIELEKLGYSFSYGEKNDNDVQKLTIGWK